MKIAAIFLLAAVIYSSAEARKCKPEDQVVVVKKCLDSTHASEVDFLELVALKSARNAKAKCFRSCLLTECDYLDKNGNIADIFAKDASLLLSAGVPEKAQKIDVAIQTCLKSEKFQGDLCEYTEDIMRCILTVCKSCGLSVPKVDL